MVLENSPENVRLNREKAEHDLETILSIPENEYQEKLSIIRESIELSIRPRFLFIQFLERRNREELLGILLSRDFESRKLQRISLILQSKEELLELKEKLTSLKEGDEEESKRNKEKNRVAHEAARKRRKRKDELKNLAGGGIQV